MLLSLLIAPLLYFRAPAPDAPPLKSTVSSRFPLGSCVNVTVLRDGNGTGPYGDTLAKNFSLVEPENELKPPALWFGPDKFDFTKTDYLIGGPGQEGWAEKHHVAVRGHVLVYARDEGYTIPGWLLKQESQISPEQAKTMLHDYIKTVAGRYKGKIAMWDVVNEAIDDRTNERPLNLRNSFWFRKLGPDFLVLAFKYAHEADPKAQLYYNEFSVEEGGAKADRLLALATYIKSHGGPITGVGLQYHTGLWDHVAKPGDAHYKLIDRIKDAGFTFMITELDCGIDVKPLADGSKSFGNEPAKPDLLEKQADILAGIYRMAASYPQLPRRADVGLHRQLQLDSTIPTRQRRCPSLRHQLSAEASTLCCRGCLKS